MKRFGLRTWFGLIAIENREEVAVAAMAVKLWIAMDQDELKWSENR